jgi:hypothetical protein
MHTHTHDVQLIHKRYQKWCTLEIQKIHMIYTRKTNKLSWRHLDVFSCWPGVFRPEPSTWCSASTSEAWSLDAYESWCSTTPEIPCDNIIYIYNIYILYL